MSVKSGSIKYLSLIILLFFTVIFPIAAQQLDKFQETLLDFEQKRFLAAHKALVYSGNPNQQRFDVHFYRLNIELIPLQKQIKGTVLIKGKSLAAGLKQWVIDLAANMQVNSVHSAGKPLRFTRTGDEIHIQALTALQKNAAFALEIAYEGMPKRNGFIGMNFTGNQHIWTLSEPFGARTWWPCKDDVKDKADSVFINITVPQALVVASNGLLKAKVPVKNGRMRYSWETRYPISTYLVMIAASNYQTFSDQYVTANGQTMPLEYYVFPEHYSQAQSDFTVTPKMLTFFAAIFGEYPFINEKYGMASIPSHASMENQTMTSLSANIINGNHSGDPVIAHELAHHWFGNALSLKYWSNIWLNEGFASYSEALWEEHSKGKTAYHRYMAQKDYGHFNGTLFIKDSTHFRSLFSSTIYQKGAWVLHMLRGVLGDAVFFKAFKQYATHQKLSFGNTTINDFQKICERVSGKSLNWFFEEWIYRAGRPEYQLSWKVQGNQSPYTVIVNITQRNSQPTLNKQPYKMPIQIRLSAASQNNTVTVWDSLPSQQFQLTCQFRPQKAVLDPEDWILKNRSRGPVSAGKLPGKHNASLLEHFELYQNIPNPFNPDTEIRFKLPITATVQIAIFDILGQRIYEKELPTLNAGLHRFHWDGSDGSGNAVGSGIYFYRFSTPQQTLMRKMILLR